VLVPSYRSPRHWIRVNLQRVTQQSRVCAVLNIKRLNVSRCCSGCGLGWTKEPRIRWGIRITPRQEGAHSGILSWHAETCLQSIFSILFIRGQQWRGLWLPVYCRTCLLPARVLAMALRLSVSVTSRCSVETVERIGLVFSVGASFHPFHTF